MNLQNGLIAEFYEQSFTQIIFPHAQTDWQPYLKEAEETFVNIINTMRRYQPCKIICADVHAVKQHFADTHNLNFVEYLCDDTWARDCSALSLWNDEKKELRNFTFNAWGNKFEATKDNAMTAFVNPEAIICDFILEGGAVESNGAGNILTTTQTMHNRYPHLSKKESEEALQKFLLAKEILFLEHGFLLGDDTDAHIDTLARFISEDTIMYVQCLEKKDTHYKELQLMEQELQTLATHHQFKLIPLPMTDAIFFEGERLPATYANFLFVNGAVLVPIYNVKSDIEAISIFEKTFPNRDIIPIDCSILIRQHGSLHCVTMNFSI